MAWVASSGVMYIRCCMCDQSLSLGVVGASTVGLFLLGLLSGVPFVWWLLFGALSVSGLVAGVI